LQDGLARTPAGPCDAVVADGADGLAGRGGILRADTVDGCASFLPQVESDMAKTRIATENEPELRAVN
jgi:hypothetical protein